MENTADGQNGVIEFQLLYCSARRVSTEFIRVYCCTACAVTSCTPYRSMSCCMHAQLITYKGFKPPRTACADRDAAKIMLFSLSTCITIKGSGHAKVLLIPSGVVMWVRHLRNHHQQQVCVNFYILQVNYRSVYCYMS